MANVDVNIQSDLNPQSAIRKSESRVRDDHILPEVHWIAGVVVLVLVAAAVILYLFPDKTAELFAWTIHPTMSALIMGAGYAAGAYYFARVFFSPKWHRVGTYFPAIATFTSILGIATIIYWDKFNHGTISFYAWVLLYFVTPFLLPILWLRNRRTDPGTPDAVDVIVPKPVRTVVGIAGLILLSVVAIMVFFPDFAISVWPWALTPAVCLSIAGWLSAPGVCYVLFIFEPRWSAWRIILQHQAIAVGLILLAAVRAWSEFNPSSLSTWVFMGGMVAFLIGIIALLLVMDSRRAKVANPSPM